MVYMQFMFYLLSQFIYIRGCSAKLFYLISLIEIGVVFMHCSMTSTLDCISRHFSLSYFKNVLLFFNYFESSFEI